MVHTGGKLRHGDKVDSEQRGSGSSPTSLWVCARCHRRHGRRKGDTHSAGAGWPLQGTGLQLSTLKALLNVLWVSGDPGKGLPTSTM